MRKLFITLVAVVTLAGCTTLGDLDSKVRQALAASCPYLEEGHDTFVELVKLFPQFEERYSDAIKATYDPAHDICLNPDTATTLKIALTVGTAAVKIYRILAEIEQTNNSAREALESP